MMTRRHLAQAVGGDAQGAGKTALVVATQLPSPSHKPRGQWWSSKIGQDLSRHPVSALMHADEASLMINWVVGTRREMALCHNHMAKYTREALRDLQRQDLARHSSGWCSASRCAMSRE